ncbi:MAG: replication initiator protein A [Lachnospiraceae bacterium]|nr:replication initiator protein A [Lachnospiraceae bacterium]
MKFNYIYGKQAEQYDYLYIPKAFMKEEPFKNMTASAKIMYALLMEKQQKSVEKGWVDTQDHVFIMVNVAAVSTELNWDSAETIVAIEELERFGLLEIAEKAEDMKLYLKRFV